ncbi:NAD(P)/FAD-dependent oxidoreductase [Methanobrevibacter sp. DSM 116169]|uniref:NAD(P)/FAD-dependent oxidoreductase n=1 Tax=Methanobrevibacter sp. DSM 116169 TaxID=3242727 RepID=UPI0038FCB07E
MIETDVLIIGGGPAGLEAGKTIALENLNVVILNKNFKNKQTQLVYKSGLEDLDLFVGNSLLNEVQELAMVSPNKNKVTLSNDNINSSEKGYLIDSEKFIQKLKKETIDLGCEIKNETKAVSLEKTKEGYKVKCQSNDTDYEINCKILIIADGYPSNVSKAFNIKSPSKYANICQCLVNGIDMDKIEFHFGSISPNGYIWIYPLKDSKVEVGISIEGDGHKKYLLKFINSYFNLNLKDIDVVEAKVPISGVINNPIRDNILVCGDAAGQYNPFIGGGIISSIKGARYTGKVAAGAIKNNDCSRDFLKRYRKLVMDDFGEDFNKLVKVRNYAFSLNDKEIDSIAISFEGVSFYNMNLLDVLKRLVSISPKAILKLGKLL